MMLTVIRLKRHFIIRCISFEDVPKHKIPEANVFIKCFYSALLLCIFIQSVIDLCNLQYGCVILCDKNALRIFFRVATPSH